MLNLCLNRPQEAREVLNAIRRDDLTDREPRLLEVGLLEWEMPEERASPRINLMKVQERHQIALIRKVSPWTSGRSSLPVCGRVRLV